MSKLIQNKKLNNYNLFYYDNDWQKPVITEYQTFVLLKDNPNLPNNYFAFPWANLIDRQLSQPIIDELLNFQIKFSNDNNSKICFTVIQHINYMILLDLLKKIGITHIFVSHKQPNSIDYSKKYNITILPYSLFPVQSINNINNITVNNNDYDNVNVIKRKYLASFIGQYESYYLTKIREAIFIYFNQYSDCKIIRRCKWHYWDMVYSVNKKTDSKFEDEYKKNLSETIFSLCPSGSGPNSIRIWESMSFGSIPVILADTLIMPQIKNLDYNDIFIFWKEDNIENLHDYLLKLKNENPEKIQKMSKLNIEIYNKYFSPHTLHTTILDYFDNNTIKDAIYKPL